MVSHNPGGSGSIYNSFSSVTLQDSLRLYTSIHVPCSMYRAGWSLPGSRALGLLCLILHCSPFASATSIPVSDTGIIRVGGTATLGLNGGGLGFQASFVDKKCRPFAFSGWNSWEVVEAAFGVASALPLNMRTPDAGKDLLDWIFDQGQGAGMNVMRFLGHGWSSKMSLQSKPGVYNEDVLVALDWVVHNAYQRGLKIVMTFADNNNEVDSRIWYAKEAGELCFPALSRHWCCALTLLCVWVWGRGTQGITDW